MSQTINKLLPCPFCASEVEAPRSRPSSTDHSEGYVAFLACYCGGYSATAHRMGKGMTEQEAVGDVIAKWNTRAIIAQPAEQPSEPFMFATLLNGRVQRSGSKSHCQEWADAWNSPEQPTEVAEVIPLYRAQQPSAAKVSDGVLLELLHTAKAHLELHAQEASHPGQYRLINRIDATLRLAAAPQPAADLGEDVK